MEEHEQTPGWFSLLTSYPARLVVYGLITMGVYQLVFTLIQSRGVAWIASENGPLETAQVVCLLIAATGIALAAWWTPIGRAALVGTGAVTVYAAARESDQWFETFFFDDAYKWLVGLPMAILVVTFVFRERRQLLQETLAMSKKPGATLFTIGGIYLCFYCQMLDRPNFWQELGSGIGLSGIGLSGTGAGLQKVLVEECAELFAYLLIMFSGFEAMISARYDRATLEQQRSMADEEVVSLPLQRQDKRRMAA